MTMRIEYVKGNNTGAIVDNGKGENKEYGAVTAVSSKWFKALKGAERFMANQGYAKA